MNFPYPRARSAYLKAEIDVLSGSTLKAMLLSATTGAGAPQNYTYSSAHEFLSDIPAGCRITPGVALTGKAVADGKLTAATLVFTAVAQIAAQTGELLLIYNDTGTESTSRLIQLLDTFTGAPVTPNGADINVLWPDGVLELAAPE